MFNRNTFMLVSVFAEYEQEYLHFLWECRSLKDKKYGY
ncbi:hypothetical protein PEC301937_22570 [Pectobacterium carotovorum subsp. carotovorum]|nr:hypothetical protein PEC301937_22570 [Pectobacterium carotovorum subsp. carotovorum]